MKVSRMTIEDSNQEIVNQEVSRVTQNTRYKKRSTPSKQTQERWTAPAPAPAPAPSDGDVDLFKLKTTEEKGYEGFICPQCKRALDSPEYLIEHQQFCPGAPAEQTTTPSSKDVCVNL